MSTKQKLYSEGKNRSVVITAVILAFLFAAALVTSVIMLTRKDSNAVAYVYSDGTLVRTVPLDTVDGTFSFRVEAPDGGYNVVEATQGRIHVTEASCPDKVCMHTGYISNSAVPISCLPNKLVIKVETSGEEDGPDVVVY